MYINANTIKILTRVLLYMILIKIREEKCKNYLNKFFATLMRNINIEKKKKFWKINLYLEKTSVEGKRI